MIWRPHYEQTLCALVPSASAGSGHNGCGRRQKENEDGRGEVQGWCREEKGIETLVLRSLWQAVVLKHHCTVFADVYCEIHSIQLLNFLKLLFLKFIFIKIVFNTFSQKSHNK